MLLLISQISGSLQTPPTFRSLRASSGQTWPRQRDRCSPSRSISPSPNRLRTQTARATCSSLGIRTSQSLTRSSNRRWDRPRAPCSLSPWASSSSILRPRNSCPSHSHSMKQFSSKRFRSHKSAQEREDALLKQYSTVTSLKRL